MTSTSDDVTNDVVVETWVATTHELPGRKFRLHYKALEGIRQALLNGRVPMHGHLDIRRRLIPRDLIAEIREMDDGEFGVWMRFSIDEAAWRALGDTRGFSISFFDDHEVTWANSDDPEITIAPDSFHWTDEDIRDAIQVVSGRHRISGERLHQLAGEPPAQIIITTTFFLLTQLGPNLAASAIWDAVKLLFSRRRTRSPEKTVCTIRVTNGNRECAATVETDNLEAVHRFLDTVESAVQCVMPGNDEGDSWRSVIEYDDETERWRTNDGYL